MGRPYSGVRLRVCVALVSPLQADLGNQDVEMKRAREDSASGAEEDDAGAADAAADEVRQPGGRALHAAATVLSQFVGRLVALG